MYNWRTGKRLELDRQQIQTKIDHAIKVIVTLEAYGEQLIGQLNWDKECAKMFDTIPELQEPPDTSERSDPTGEA